MSSPDSPPLAARLQALEARVAARAGGRPVTLVAASKGQPASALREAHAAGQRVFGENYVQELVEKAAALSDLDVEWHFIGTLQRNKARKVLEIARVVHAVDRPELARALARVAAELGVRPRLLVEVNVGGEASKGGVAPDALAPLLAALAAEGLPASGLMTLPPPGTPEATRPYFAALRGLAHEHLGPRAELSMGMSEDFEVAVEEGATLVRVGTALFGPRPPRRAP